MSMLRWEPFADLTQLRDQMNRLFDQSLTRTGREPAAVATWAPLVDIQETEDAIVLHAEVPGVKPENIDIQLSGDTLTIRGERRVVKEEKNKSFVRTERAYGVFQRSFTLGIPIDQAKVTAHYEDGVLELTLPKAEEVKPKQIKIEVAGGPKSVEANK
jgi:HSP20 family protein